MAYNNFTLESAEAAFGLLTQPGELFPGLRPAPVPDWLRDLLERGRRVAALVSEKARSEFLVVPVLLAAQELVPGALAIYSGRASMWTPSAGWSVNAITSSRSPRRSPACGRRSL